MESGDGPVTALVIFLILLLVDFVLSGFGSAIQAVSESALASPDREEDRTARSLSDMKERPERLIRTCWFFHILASGAGTWMFVRTTRMPEWIGLILAMTLIYVFGKAVPTLLGRRYAHGWCRRLQGTVRVLLGISLLFTYVFDAVTHVIVRIFRVDPRELEDEVTEDEIISMVNEGHEQGVLDEHEAEMIQNIFELDDKEARDIMTHRKNISAISGDVNLADAISIMVEETNSRFPVYDGDIDNITGILHLKDAMIFHNRKQFDEWLIRDIPGLLRTAEFIPETRSIHLLFRSMQAQKQQMVIVVDEYGQTVGLVTMEDILEEIVGNIQDEYDVEERFILAQEDGSFRMAGMTPLPDVEEALGITLDEEDYDTLNGYLVYRLDRIPAEDDHSVIREQGYDFRILEVENKMIKWVSVVKLPAIVSDDPSERKTEQTAEEKE